MARIAGVTLSRSLVIHKDGIVRRASSVALTFRPRKRIELLITTSASTPPCAAALIDAGPPLLAPTSTMRRAPWLRRDAAAARTSRAISSTRRGPPDRPKPRKPHAAARQ